MGRSPCCEKEHTNKGAWTKEEDERLINYIKLHGEGCWRSLPKAAGLLRCGKSCRLRWINYLRPDLKRGNFTEQEDDLIINLHTLLGNKYVSGSISSGANFSGWSLIAAKLPGRTDNEIKNYWNTHIKRKLYSRGVDPQTHRPLNDSTASTTSNKNTIINNISIINSSSNNNNNNGSFQLVSGYKNAKINVTKLVSEDSNSNSSSAVSSEETYHHQQLINLDLSIGLPSLTSHTQVNTNKLKLEQLQGDEQQETKVITTSHGLCLCYSLGFQSNQVCCCNKTIGNSINTTTAADTNMYRFYRPMDI
ncbi:hypothetical protein TSUD_318260 [Trifolium subterraneum]|uniref:Uncharacterized protein n=2 Tax=Trifolium TaxID=3898 RepID=A0A2Z6MVX8_TRISU|nr:hypothetical protein TSUD_318260 [Trifolium subterraneum]